MLPRKYSHTLLRMIGLVHGGAPARSQPNCGSRIPVGHSDCVVCFAMSRRKMLEGKAGSVQASHSAASNLVIAAKFQFAIVSSERTGTIGILSQ
jgi:hypothetical protein